VGRDATLAGAFYSVSSPDHLSVPTRLHGVQVDRISASMLSDRVPVGGILESHLHGFSFLFILFASVSCDVPTINVHSLTYRSGHGCYLGGGIL